MKYKFIKENIKIDHLDENFIASSYSSNTTQLVARFYEPDPFPNYNEADNIFDLTEEVLQNKFLKILKKKIGFGKSFIEVGSGTSQLSIALAHATNNFVVAFDPTRNALMLGKNFAKSNNIKNCLFFNSDIFDDPIRPESFDFVWCSGVLHHTKNPYGGFKII